MTVDYVKNVMNVRRMMSNLNPEYLDVMTTLKIVRLVGGYTLEEYTQNQTGCGAMNEISILPLTPLQSWVFLITIFYLLYRWVTR